MGRLLLVLVAATIVTSVFGKPTNVLTGQGKFDVPFLEPALQFFTHLIYRSAGINAETFKLVPLNDVLNLDVGKNQYREETQLKRRFPTLKGVTSGGDPTAETYVTLLESVEPGIAFVNSAYTLIKANDFDGIDLAWQFPPNKPKRVRGKLSSFFHSLL